MSARNILMAAGGSADDKLYVDDVFSAYTYTGNSSTQTINNGIDLAGKGGLVWLKSRDIANAQMLYDTIRGGNQYLSANTTSAQIDRTPSITSWNQNGFSVAGNDGNISYPGYNYISWTFRKSPKFFDVVTYTGDGAASRQIAHSLGITPGMVILKKTSDITNWFVIHKDIGANVLILNGTNAVINGLVTQPTPSVFTVHTGMAGNDSGAAYVAYLFAHDPSADGIIQCGSFTTDAGGISTPQNLGWEPQYLMVKRTNAADDWNVFDVMRGFGKPTYNCKTLYPNLANAEGEPSVGVEPEATGFKANGLLASSTYIYLAIRRPNKPPTTGTQVYNHLTRTGTGAVGSTAAVGFAPDLAISQSISVGRTPTWVDRLRGVKRWLRSDAASEEVTQTTSGLSSFDMLGVSYTADNTEQPFAWNNTGETKHQRFFKRAPGFMDVVCRSGTGASLYARVDVSHSLGVAPELIIYKCRSNTSNWVVGAFDPSVPTKNRYGQLNQTNTIGETSFPGDFLYAAPTATQFSFWDGNGFGLDVSGRTYITYLFASLPGISKVGSYTGNGTTQTINCGFTTGARFILIKRTNSTGDWYVWDTARGVVAGNDPHLSLNTTAAEVTTNDSIDPDASGFIVNQVAATNINVSGGTYIFLAIA